MTLNILRFNNWLVNAILTVSTSGNSGMINNQFKNLKNISSDQKSNVVKKVFNDVYENYDLMNDIMSIGMHRLWKSQVFELINPNSNDKFMDLAGGSGDLSKIIKKNIIIHNVY